MLNLIVKRWFSLSASFTLLGLKPTCKIEDVKRKYYELAKTYHPDLNSTDKNAHNKFSDITKAYKFIISNYDEEKGHYEAQYAQSADKKTESSSQKFKNQKKQKTRVEEEYEDFYDYDNFFKQSKKFRKPRAGEDIYINLTITLQEAILGAQKSFQYTKYEPCSVCHDKQFSSCFSCGGKGQIYDRANRQKVRCQYCSGKGFRNECGQCRGASYVLKEVKDKIYIQKGTKDKSILKVQRKGHSGYKSGNGDLYITVFIEQNNKFKMDGNNVHMEYELDYVTAVIGGNVQIQTVYGMRSVTIPPGTQSGAEIRLFNLGMKSPYSKRMGDQIIKIKIKIPDRLNQKQKQLIKQLHSEEC